MASRYAQRRDWSRLCSPQEEILGYLDEVARDHQVDGLLVPDTDVRFCRWDDAWCRWTVSGASGGVWNADAVVIATGQLHRPAIPLLEGQGSFRGHSFHSARWDHGYQLGGKRVAVIGTGASAVQFVPEVAKEAACLFGFQRTGNWFLPRKNRPYPRALKAIIGHVPGVQAARRWYWYVFLELLTLGIRHPGNVGRMFKLRSAVFMRRQLRDPEVRRNAWPHYTWGCKRVLLSSHFLPALQRPNVELVTEPIVRLTATGVVTADGSERNVDCIIYATGFRASEFMFPMEVVGTHGRNLRDTWKAGPHAHLGISVPGFPSLFLMYGPNTNTSGGSVVFYAELQAAYIRQALEHVRDRGAAAIDVRPEVEAASDREVQARFAGSAWTQCDSWYQNASGRIVTNWPGSMTDYRRRARVLDPGDFEFVPLPDRSSVALAPAQTTST